MKIFFIGLSVLVSGALYAQGPQPRARMSPGGNFDPDQHTELRLTRSLNLTAEQQNKLHTALAERKLAVQGNREKMQALHTAMTAAIKAGDENQMEKVSQDMAALHQQETVAHARTAAKIYSSLSADQKTKVGDHLQMLMGGGGRGFGGPGGPRPPRAQ